MLDFSLRFEPCLWVGYAMAMSPDKAETAVRGCLVPAPVILAVCMATPRGWFNVYASCFLNLFMRTLSTSMSIRSDGGVFVHPLSPNLDVRLPSPIQKHCFVQFWEGTNSKIKQATVDNNPVGARRSNKQSNRFVVVRSEDFLINLSRNRFNAESF